MQNRRLQYRRLAWITDPHLNFVDLPHWDQLASAIQRSSADAVLISGDISESEDIVLQLRRMVYEFKKPICFVLGNHDFYHGAIANVRKAVDECCRAESRLTYLTGETPLLLCPDADSPEHTWALIGDDGWADGRVGDYYRSPVGMNDFRLIRNLSGLDAMSRLKVLRRLGVSSAVRLRRQLALAAQQTQRILVLTHIPPFRESCWYEGQQSNDDWAPFFVCHAVGWMLRRFCAAHPSHEVLVLCGHTHHGGTARMAENLFVWTGNAEYGKPGICEVIDLADFAFPTADWDWRTA